MPGSTTQISLLTRLRDPADVQAWAEFEARYGELVVRYCRHCGLQHADAEDIRQTVMLSMAKVMRRFEYCPGRGRFRDYLRRATRNAIAQWAQRPNAALRALSIDAVAESAAADMLDARWDLEWVRFQYRRAMCVIRQTHDPESVRIFDRLLAGASIAQVADEFGTSTQAVHKVKQRIRDRLKQLIAEQIREEDQGG